MAKSVQLTEQMDNKRERVVRFDDYNSEGSTSSEQPMYPSVGSLSPERRVSFRLALDVIRQGIEKGSQEIRSLSFQSLYYPSPDKPGFESKVLDPQGSFLQKWNKIFLISCVFALAWDPLFFYIPFVDRKNKCLKWNVHLKIVACVLRTFSDLFYLLHIIIQFRTGFISPSSRVLGRGELIKDPVAIARRYLFSYFFVDVLAVLPLPQVLFLRVYPYMQGGHHHMTSKGLLKLVIFTQYAPRIFRIYPLYKGVTRTSGIITETAWAGAAFNLLLYMLASHAVGAGWYLFAIDRQHKCWHLSCHGPECPHLSLYCTRIHNHTHQGHYTFDETYCSLQDPEQITDASVFNFGMFYDALQSRVVESGDIFDKVFYCFWWGLRNLSSLGQNLKTSTSIRENLYATFICVFGLFLFSLLIGNMQKYLQSTTVRIEEMRVRRQDAEQWMSHRMLPEELRERIRRHEQYKWQETRGVDEEMVILNLPKDLRRDIKRHLCLALLMRVPMIEKMDEQLIDAMCDRLKPVLYTENSFIVREGDPVTEMLFIMRGELLTMTTNGGRTGFFNSVFLNAGDFCGEELLTWALDPRSSSNLPISTRTVQSKTEVEAFALMPEDLKIVASQFHTLNSKQLRQTFRFYSQQWRTWAACFIQIAWRQHCRRRKLEKCLQEAEDRLKDALARGGGSPPSLGATIYASRFAVNALRNLRRNGAQNSRMTHMLSPLHILRKPTEPDFTSEG